MDWLFRYKTSDWGLIQPFPFTHPFPPPLPSHTQLNNQPSLLIVTAHTRNPPAESIESCSSSEIVEHIFRHTKQASSRGRKGGRVLNKKKDFRGAPSARSITQACRLLFAAISLIRRRVIATQSTLQLRGPNSKEPWWLRSGIWKALVRGGVPLLWFCF